MPSETVFQIKATLREAKPPIWRRVLVPSTIHLGDLHAVMQAAFGWWDSHLHEWNIAGIEYGMADLEDDDWRDEPINDEGKFRLCDVAYEGMKLDYVYDYGDNWRHQLLIEQELPAKREAYPRLVAGRRACPPEDVGGVSGYERFLEALADPSHEEHDEFVEWSGGTFDPEDAKLDGFFARLGEHAAARM